MPKTRIHDTIEQIIQYRERCIFCNSKLKTILTNSVNFNDCLSTLTSEYKDNKFEFNLEYSSDSTNLAVKARVDPHNNLLIFDKPIQSSYSGRHTEEQLYKQAAWVFDKLAAHTESYCPKRKCGLNYHFISNMFNIVPISSADQTRQTIAPVYLSAECFKVDNFWVQNELTTYKTYIFSTKDMHKSPVITDLIEFGSLDKDKLLNKIKMITVFA